MCVALFVYDSVNDRVVRVLVRGEGCLCLRDSVGGFCVGCGVCCLLLPVRSHRVSFA